MPICTPKTRLQAHYGSAGSSLVVLRCNRLLCKLARGGHRNHADPTVRCPKPHLRPFSIRQTQALGGSGRLDPK
jgi:hypothetical protein